MPFIKTPNGLKWHYEIDGEGPHLFFIHGWGVNSHVWRQQSKYFSRGYKVLTIDLPGHGESSWQAVSLEDMARDCTSILEKLGFSDVIIVGSSLGGLVALKMFAICPQGIKSMVFVGSHPKFVRTEDYPFGLKACRIRKIARQLKTNYPSMLNIFFRSLFTIQERKTRRFKWIHTFRKTDIIPEKSALVELLRILEQEDLRHVLNNVSVPVQFINGTEDFIFQKELFNYWKGRILKARFDWFEQCGHFPFLSKPHEFNQILEEFLLDVKS